MPCIGELKKLVASMPTAYYKLILLVGESGSGKTSLIREICGLSENFRDTCKIKDYDSAEDIRNIEKANNCMNYMNNNYEYKYINLNLALSEKLKEIPLTERCLYVQDYIDEIINTASRNNSSDILILDNNEIIFSKHLQIDPLRLLKNISKYRKVISAWPGSIKDEYLTYAEPWHNDYVKYSLNDLECLYINLDRGIRL